MDKSDSSIDFKIQPTFSFEKLAFYLMFVDI